MVTTRSQTKKDVITNPSVFKGTKDLDILTGDHGIEPAEELQDFIWSMSDEPHASRRKAMIKEHKDLKNLMGHEPKTKYIVVLLMALQFYLGYYLREEALWGGTVKFWLIAYVIGATTTQALFLAIHEISHNLAFKKFNHNKLFGIFANLPMVIPFFMMFKHYHNEHHKYQGVEGIDTDLPTEFEAKLLRSTIGKWIYMFNQTWFYALRPVFIRQQKFTSWHLLNTTVQLSFNAAVVYFIGWGPIFYFLACAHLGGSLHPMASHFIAEHYVFAGEIETASYYGPLNYLAFNVGYHNEHHDFPTVPWSRLPMLHELGGDWYKNIPFHKSWVAALLKFLFDPTINMYNRVKREDKLGMGENTIAAGGRNDNADYTGSWLLGTGWGEKKVD